MTQPLTSSGKALNGSSTPGTQAEFPIFANSFPPRAAVVSKRPRGRPKGPRGFIFRVPGSTARTAFDCAVDLHGKARQRATSALVARRSRGDRDAWANLEAIRGRHTLHFAFACALAGFLRIQGGVV